MSAKKLNKKTVHSSEYENYLHTAEQFFTGAESANSESNYTASAVLAIHAAIAYTDAVTIRFGNVKHSGDQHSCAADLLRQIMELTDNDERAINRFSRLIAEKTKVSYTGTTFTSSKVSSMLKDLERYREWVQKKLS